MVAMDAKDMELLKGCCAFEPWLEKNLSVAQKNKKKGRFMLRLDAEEQEDLLNAMVACADRAREEGRADEAMDYDVLHDIIILTTPGDFGIMTRPFPQDHAR
jgi:hypothetical protein